MYESCRIGRRELRPTFCEVHVDNLALTPLLNREMLDVDVSRAWRRLAFIDHRNSGLVVLVEWGWTFRWVAQLIVMVLVF